MFLPPETTVNPVSRRHSVAVAGASETVAVNARIGSVLERTRPTADFRFLRNPILTNVPPISEHTSLPLRPALPSLAQQQSGSTQFLSTHTQCWPLVSSQRPSGGNPSVSPLAQSAPCLFTQVEPPSPFGPEPHTNTGVLQNKRFYAAQSERVAKYNGVKDSNVRPHY